MNNEYLNNENRRTGFIMVRDMLMFWRSQGSSLKFLLKKIKLFAIFCHFSVVIFSQFQVIKIRKIKIWKIISLCFDKIIPLTLRKAFLPGVAVRKYFSNKRPQHRCFPVNIKKFSRLFFYRTPPMATSVLLHEPLELLISNTLFP